MRLARIFLSVTTCFALFASPLTARADLDPAWTRAIKPFAIADNLYYVGSADLASYLVTTRDGLILINANLDVSPPQIRENVEKLGFKWADIKILLNNQAHWDHMAGAAQILTETQAMNYVMDGDDAVSETGGHADFLWGSDSIRAFAPAHVDHVLHDKEQVTLGGVTLVAHKTAGHTRGDTTFTLRAHLPGEPAKQMRDIVIVGGARFWDEYHLDHGDTSHESYPGLTNDLRLTLQRLQSLHCDVFLGAHGVYFDMLTKLKRYKRAGPKVFIDPDGYHNYVLNSRKNFEEAMARGQ